MTSFHEIISYEISNNKECGAVTILSDEAYNSVRDTYGDDPMVMTVADLERKRTEWLQGQTYTSKDVEEITGLSQRLQRDWRRRGYLPRISGQARYTYNDLIEIAIKRELAEFYIIPACHNPYGTYAKNYTDGRDQVSISNKSGSVTFTVNIRDIGNRVRAACLKRWSA